MVRSKSNLSPLEIKRKIEIQKGIFNKNRLEILYNFKGKFVGFTQGRMYVGSSLREINEIMDDEFPGYIEEVWD